MPIISITDYVRQNQHFLVNQTVTPDTAPVNNIPFKKPAPLFASMALNQVMRPVICNSGINIKLPVT